MIMNSTVSVVIPTHNRPILLKRAIESALQQTLTPNEIIIVDDADSQETKNAIKSFNNDIISYVSNPNSGASSSRNLGASIAKSAYIAFLDDDDIWLSNKLEQQVAEITTKDLDACFSRMMIEYESKGINYSTMSRNLDDPKKEILLNNYIGATISSIIKKEKFLEVGGFDPEFPAREEYDLWIRLIYANSRISIIEIPLAVSYRSLNNRGRISQNIDNYKKANEMLLQKHCEKISSVLGSHGLESVRYNHKLFLAAQATSINLRGEAVKSYLAALNIKFSLKILIMFFIGLISPIALIRIRAMLS